MHRAYEIGFENRINRHKPTYLHSQDLFLLCETEVLSHHKRGEKHIFFLLESGQLMVSFLVLSFLHGMAFDNIA